MVISVIRHRTRGLVAKRTLALTFLKMYMRGQDPPTPSLGPTLLKGGGVPNVACRI